MRRVLRQLLAAVISSALLSAPVYCGTSNALGFVVSAERARVGAGQASAGLTVFEGERLSTEAQGTLRLRAGATQIYLPATSTLSLHQTESGTVAALHAGTLVFSTATARGLEVLASEARIRPRAEGATAGEVTVISPQELIVASRRGTLEISVDDETQLVPEVTSYRVLMHSPEIADPQGPRGVGAKGQRRGPRRAGRSRFLLVALMVTGVVTAIAVHEALESPDRP